MIALPERDGGKATFMVAFHLAPLALVLLASFVALYSLLNQLGFSGIAKNRVDETPPLIQVINISSQDESVSSIFSDEITHWQADIKRWSAEYKLNPNLIAIVMQIESCGHPNITSFAGAQGLFQVMPFHFAEGENPLDPDVNAHRGLGYFVRALQLAQGDVSLAMAGYNGGHALIAKHPMHWPQETNRYVYWASGIYADIKKGAGESPRLAEWMAAGGESLCARASLELNF